MSANILTVDDSASIRLTTNVALSSAGYAVTEAVNGAEGIAKATSGQFDLIVTDMAVIGFDGGTITLLETAPGMSVAEVMAVTEAELTIPDQVPEMKI